MAQTEKKDVKKLYLSNTDKVMSGVCGGIAEYFEVDATLVRLGWVAGSIITGFFPGLFAYIIFAIVIPPKPA